MQGGGSASEGLGPRSQWTPALRVTVVLPTALAACARTPLLAGRVRLASSVLLVPASPLHVQEVRISARAETSSLKRLSQEIRGSFRDNKLSEAGQVSLNLLLTDYMRLSAIYGSLTQDVSGERFSPSYRVLEGGGGGGGSGGVRVSGGGGVGGLGLVGG